MEKSHPLWAVVLVSFSSCLFSKLFALPPWPYLSPLWALFRFCRINLMICDISFLALWIVLFLLFSAHDKKKRFPKQKRCEFAEKKRENYILIVTVHRGCHRFPLWLYKQNKSWRTDRKTTRRAGSEDRLKNKCKKKRLRDRANEIKR